MKSTNYPWIFIEMHKRGYLSGSDYLQLNDMHWKDYHDIESYQYSPNENQNLIPFAVTGAGDLWVWIIDGESDEYYVGLCENPESYGTYYAKDLEDAIVRRVIDYASSPDLYEESPEACDLEAHNYLNYLIEKLGNLLSEEKINIIKELATHHLKPAQSKYGTWDALISLDEAEDLVKTKLGFDLMDKQFEWYKE